ncbi:MAG: hypothetical protein CMM05_05390, partial [Rhodopirellula sp.]|nr:hypothetical protein [Rhodopirellula sp.]
AWTKACFFALKSAGVKTEFYSIANAGHMQAAMDVSALEKACDFLAAVLMPESKPARIGEIDNSAQAGDSAHSSRDTDASRNTDASSDATSSRDSDR